MYGKKENPPHDRQTQGQRLRTVRPVQDGEVMQYIFDREERVA